MTTIEATADVQRRIAERDVYESLPIWVREGLES